MSSALFTPLSTQPCAFSLLETKRLRASKQMKRTGCVTPVATLRCLVEAVLFFLPMIAVLSTRFCSSAKVGAVLQLKERQKHALKALLD